MPSRIYYDLRKQLDEYSVGFPETESGVEMKILEKLFSEDEAEAVPAPQHDARNI